MTNTRIGMILDAPYPPDIRVSNECDTLINSGFEVHLFALSYDKTYLAYEIVDNVHVHRYYCSPTLYKFSALAYTFPYYHNRMKKMVSSFIQKIDTKHIHIHDLQIARSVFQLKERYNLNITLDLHENRPEIMKYYKHVKSLSGRMIINPKKWKLFEEKYVKEANGVVVVTEFAKKELLERISIEEDKIIVLPNTSGLLFTNHHDFDKTIIDKYSNSFILLYIGDTSERRGLITAIEGVSLIRDKIKNIQLIIVGKSSFDITLRMKVEALNLQNIVIFEGWQEPQLLPTFIESCKVGISPLYKNIHHDTTYANKIFQYMSLGKPILVSDCTAQEELVKETICGLVFRNKSAEDFAKKTLEIYENRQQFQTFASNAKKAVETKYNWNNTGKALADYYLNQVNL